MATKEQVRKKAGQTVIDFECSHCGHRFSVPESYAGKHAKCSKCHQPLRVPHASPPADDVLHVAPPARTPDTVRETRCPQCGAGNRADAQFCSACAASMKASQPAPVPTSGSVGLAVAASVGLTFAGVAVWVVLAYFSGWFWLQFLSVGVAVLAGYGLSIATDKRSASMGILAMVIALVGIVSGKLIIVYWVVMPQADAIFQDTATIFQDSATISDEKVDEAIKNPDAMFTYACYHLADELEWDWEFTNQLVFFRAFSGMRTRPGTRPKMPPEEAEKLREAIKTVNEKIAGWSEAEKRQVVVSGFERQRGWLKDGIRAITNTGTEANEPNGAPPAFVEEGIDVVVGEKPFSESLIGRGFAWGSTCCLDFIWIPLGLFLAYKIATRE